MMSFDVLSFADVVLRLVKTHLITHCGVMVRLQPAVQPQWNKLVYWPTKVRSWSCVVAEDSAS